ncbi:hypothetical protein ACFLU6_12205 [Acidobacteriota bacterium]
MRRNSWTLLSIAPWLVGSLACLTGDAALCSVSQAQMLAALPGLILGGITVEIAQGEQDVTVYGADRDDWLGRWDGVWSGDLNDDGITDLVLGASRAGAAYVLFGPFVSGTVLDLRDGADVAVYGADAWDNLGCSVRVADLNGDGVDDLILSAAYAAGPTNSRSQCGEVYVIFGPFSSGRVINLSSESPDVLIYGAEAGDRLGGALGVGDVTGDSAADLVLLAQGGDGPPGDPTRGNSGEAYVLAGPFVSGTVVDLALGADVIIYGADPNDGLCLLALCDVNADDRQDVLLGAPSGEGPGNSREQAGEVYVLFGSLAVGARIDLRTQGADVTVYGPRESSWLKLAACGDVIPDGVADIVVSEFEAEDPLRPGNPVRPQYVFSGPFQPGQVVDLLTDPPDVTIAWHIDSGGGSIASVADLTGDGIADLVTISMYGGGGPIWNEIGAANVLFGPFVGGQVVDMVAGEPDIAVYGADIGDWLGMPHATPDIDGDGRADILLAAPKADGPLNLRTDCGEAYVVLSRNLHPVADAGGPYQLECTNQSVDVQLSGSGSSDPNGDPITFQWQTDCPGASFSDATSPDPILTLLNVPSTLGCTVTLTVTDDQALSTQDLASITVIVPSIPPDIGNLLHVTLEGSNPRLSWEDYSPSASVTHYHVRRSAVKGAFPPDPSAQPSDAFWVDTTAMAQLFYYDVRAAVDCDEMESLD